MAAALDKGARPLPPPDLTMDKETVKVMAARILEDDECLEYLDSIVDRFVGNTRLCLNVEVMDDNAKVHTVPLHYRAAHKRGDAGEWTLAEEKEIAGLQAKHVYEWCRIEDVPPGMKILTTKYVYDYKTDENNTILRYKARLVVRGFEQRDGIEYGETFSATVRATSVRLVLSLAAELKLKLWQLDVEQAFLTADLNADIVYARPPPGQERRGHVWRLKKALYGLKQASHLFENHFSAILVQRLGMTRLKGDRSIYIMTRKRGQRTIHLIVCVYVDDLIIAYGDVMILDEFRNALQTHIKMKDMGPLKYCLGMLITQDPVTFTVSVNQSGFVEDLLTRTGHNTPGEATRATPAPAGVKLSKQDCPSTPEDLADMEQPPYNTYRSIVGAMIYLTGATRPDIGFAVNVLDRYVQNPGRAHWHSLTHLMKYLKGTRELGVHYCGNKEQGIILEDERKRGLPRTNDDLPNPVLLSESFRNNLIAYADSDWAGDLDTRRSTGWWVTMMNGGPVSWRVKRQDVVANSSSESELYALGDCMKEVMWLQGLLKELGLPQPQKRPGRGGRIADGNSMKNRGSVIYEDNESCISMTQNDVYHQRTKHSDTMVFRDGKRRGGDCEHPTCKDGRHGGRPSHQGCDERRPGHFACPTYGIVDPGERVRLLSIA
jgi:hypothetical protein